MPDYRTIRGALDGATHALQGLAADAPMVARLEQVADLLANSLGAGHTLLACGNGGSLCDASHFVEELTGRFRQNRPPLAAIACADPGHLTCTANDFGFDDVFARWVLALARPGDVLILLSTSGNSENILRAAKAASEKGARTVALLGKGGGHAASACDNVFIVPGDSSDRIQELHMLILHAWVEAIETRLFGS